MIKDRLQRAKPACHEAESDLRNPTGQTGVTRALILGLQYFAVVFSFAFAMGVARTLVIAPWIGLAEATILEVPVVLLASWHVARRLLRPQRLTVWQRAGMGASAFVLTMASEAALAALLFDQTITAWAGALASPLGLFGLGGQLGFAAIPVLAGIARPVAE